ncbi:MAG: hypothetical protein QHJ73_02840 [Armatimonadota bacterium]|nr:hypothetical protein [Armatimonadota bacterium]
MRVPPGYKTYEEHRAYLHEVVRLKLWFVWNWLRQHPDEPFQHVLRQRVDIYRKTHLNPEHLNPRVLHFDSPGWVALEERAQELYQACKEDPDAARFERLAFAVFQPAIDARAPRDYAEDCAGAQLEGYQCGSLRYDAPRENAPGVVTFHIANAVRPRSIFDDPTYLPRCFFQLMDECEARFGAHTLRTCTWLNSYPRWLTLFPEEWHRNMGPPDKDVRWHYGFWGQFISARGTFNHRYGRLLRETGEFPYSPRCSYSSFSAMRRHLQGWVAHLGAER